MYHLIFVNNVLFIFYHFQSGLGSDEDLGLELVGGRDDPQYPNDSGIYISSVAKNSITEGKLKYVRFCYFCW